MSDLISRQAVINAIANTCFWLSADNWEELTKCINSIPSADILEHARAIKEYCENTDCKECFIKKRCGGCGWEGLRPFKWDLPEGEKEPPVFIDSAPLKDCKNTAESYGEICVKCNKCGRFGREKE